MHVSFRIDTRLCTLVLISGLIGLYAVLSAFPIPDIFYPKTSADLAAWFQFFGGVSAVGVAIYFSRHEQRVKQREDEHVAYVTAINLLSNLTVNTIQLNRLYLLLNTSGGSMRFKTYSEKWCEEINKITPPTESQFMNIARAPSSGGVLLAEAWGEIEYLKRCIGLWVDADLPKLFIQGDYTLVQVAYKEYASQFSSICRDILTAHKKAEMAIKDYCYKHPIGKFSNLSNA